MHNLHLHSLYNQDRHTLPKNTKDRVTRIESQIVPKQLPPFLYLKI